MTNFNFVGDEADEESLKKTAEILGLDQLETEQQEQPEKQLQDELISEETMRMIVETAFQLAAMKRQKEFWMAEDKELDFLIPRLTADVNKNAFFRRILQRTKGADSYGYLAYMIVKRLIKDIQEERSGLA